MAQRIRTAPAELPQLKFAIVEILSEQQFIKKKNNQKQHGLCQKTQRERHTVYRRYLVIAV